MAQGYLTQTAPQMAPPSAGDQAIGMVVGALELGGTGAALAYLNARNPSEGKTYHEMFGYPTDVVVGVAGVSLGILLALFGSKAYTHVLMAGLGALSEAGIRMSFEKGVEDRDEEKKTLKQRKDLRLVPGQPAQKQSMQKSSSQEVFQPVG